jgi:raffinose/stachyose/melibiose transport system permease protein
MMKTIPIGLNDFIGTYGQRDWGLTFAAIFVTILPTLLIFFFLNKQVMDGMTAGAVKE